MALLRIASSVDEFMHQPLGAGILVETSFVWCASPSLGGSTVWASPSGKQTERVMEVLSAIFHPSLGLQLDIVLDAYRLEHATPGAVMAIFDWTRRNLGPLSQRIRRQVGVSPPGLGGILLAGILPMLGSPYGFAVVPTPEEAYRVVLGGDGDALREEIGAHVDRFSGTPPLVGELRNLLRAYKGSLQVERAAQLLGRSPRSLQRELEEASTSYRHEQAQARLVAVEQLLASTDDKLALVAERVGLSLQQLNRLIRDRTGTTIAAWRSRLRSR